MLYYACAREVRTGLGIAREQWECVGNMKEVTNMKYLKLLCALALALALSMALPALAEGTLPSLSLIHI